MFRKYEIMIALRYLKSKRQEGFISVVSAFSFVGIALGVATLIIVMSVMNGYEVELIQRILGINGHITVVSSSDKIRDYPDTITAIKGIKGVAFVAPMISEQGMMTTNYGSSGIAVRAMAAADILDKPLLQSSIKIGSLDDYGDNGVLVGITLAHKLRLKVGDSVKIIVPRFDSTMIGSIPRIKTFKVVGIFDVGMYEYNATTVFIPIQPAQLLFNYGEAVSDIEVVLKKDVDIYQIKTQLVHQLPTDLQVIDWTLSNQSIISVLKVERSVMFLILTLIILVAAFNIISSLIMLVKEKAKNIAILRTIGLERRSVIKIFILSGSIVGIIGTTFGAALGIVFSLYIEKVRAFLESLLGVTLFDPLIYFLTQLPSVMDVTSIIQVVGMSITLSILATIYPAWKASKLTPAEVLRYE
ncbi:lipoprotein-releasing ABC transporter permease subunit [Rickettsiales endosymbiont of Peranema trichophorum]|uniref:lipoprotein-releasing ABC transporter permease subunit n=1 Tax=Rickettsiales endosymbiont of Peranema trichophorum TaxID=2486577 RepID=UPI001023C21F|nr:lipoprotein-releasing ABC transporter permease subunit [Rickettsiales endosymbiont of Peranema trichophorum]RZI47195.1 lipoprotein-releasing ABC transporter permease subunit [Rickettsiales endosymbiont of Peranema trichophorum]